VIKQCHENFFDDEPSYLHPTIEISKLKASYAVANIDLDIKIEELSHYLTIADLVSHLKQFLLK
jgi:hypothetical protein